MGTPYNKGIQCYTKTKKKKAKQEEEEQEDTNVLQWYNDTIDIQVSILSNTLGVMIGCRESSATVFVDIVWLPSSTVGVWIALARSLAQWEYH